MSTALVDGRLLRRIINRPYSLYVVAWLSGNALVSINGVTLRRARLILGWVTSAGKPSWYNQPPSSTQPFILSGSINEYVGGKGVRITSVGWQVTLCVWSHYDKWSHERIRGLLTYNALYKSTYTLLYQNVASVCRLSSVTKPSRLEPNVSKTAGDAI